MSHRRNLGVYGKEGGCQDSSVDSDLQLNGLSRLCNDLPKEHGQWAACLRTKTPDIKTISKRYA